MHFKNRITQTSLAFTQWVTHYKHIKTGFRLMQNQVNVTSKKQDVVC